MNEISIVEKIDAGGGEKEKKRHMNIKAVERWGEFMYSYEYNYHNIVNRREKNN